MPEALRTETSERRQSRGSVAEEIPPPSASAFTGSASGLRHPAPRTEGTVSAGFRLHLTQVGTGCKHRNNKQPASSVNEQGGGLHDGTPPSSHLCFRTTAGHRSPAVTSLGTTASCLPIPRIPSLRGCREEATDRAFRTRSSRGSNRLTPGQLQPLRASRAPSCCSQGRVCSGLCRALL